MFLDRLLVGLALLLSAQAGQSRINEDSARDLRQTIKARALLADEPELAALNIGVVVRNRVAILWGPVPSIEAAFRAELVLREMFELTEVRNELFVSDLLVPVRKPLKIENAPEQLPDSTLPKLPAVPRLPLGAPAVLMGGDVKRPISQPTANEKPLPRLPHLDAPVQDGDHDLESAVRTRLSEEARFRQVQFIVKNGRVYLRTLGGDSEALREAARVISRLPNVAGVVLVEAP